jgi:PadR family transcriptional regulator PadR
LPTFDSSLFEGSQGVPCGRLFQGQFIPLTFYPNQEYASPRMSTQRIELLQGTLDLLILRTLLSGPAHGHAIAKNIERNSEEVLQVEQGSLYPALHRLIRRGWISAEEGVSENNRRAKFYRLTAAGRKQLKVETSRWEKLARAIAGILNAAGQEGKS